MTSFIFIRTTLQMGNCCAVLGEMKNLFSWESHCSLRFRDLFSGKERSSSANAFTVFLRPFAMPMDWSHLRWELWRIGEAGISLGRVHCFLGSGTEWNFCMVVRGLFPILCHQRTQTKVGPCDLDLKFKGNFSDTALHYCSQSPFHSFCKWGFSLCCQALCALCRQFLVSGADCTMCSFSPLIWHSDQMSYCRTVSNSWFCHPDLFPYSVFCP